MPESELAELKAATQAQWPGDIVADLDFAADLMKRTLEELPIEEEHDYSRFGGPWAAFRRTLEDTLRMLDEGKYEAAREMIDLLKRTWRGASNDR